MRPAVTARNFFAFRISVFSSRNRTGVEVTDNLDVTPDTVESTLAGDVRSTLREIGNPLRWAGEIDTLPGDVLVSLKSDQRFARVPARMLPRLADLIAGSLSDVSILRLRGKAAKTRKEWEGTEGKKRLKKLAGRAK